MPRIRGRCRPSRQPWGEVLKELEGCVDLHLHTTRSDGTMTPAEVVQYARMKGLRAISITDHDTVGGNEEAIEEGRRLGVEVIPGVDLSIAFQPGEFHLLGYFIDYENRELQRSLGNLREHRRMRNPQIVQKLAQMGIVLNLQDIQRTSPNENVGRPHIAAAMVEAGYVQTVQEAFDRYLKKDGPAYVPKEYLTPEQGIAMIHRHGGIPVLAHPHTLEIGTLEKIGGIIERLCTYGLMGIEVWYSGNSPRKSAIYKSLATRHGLCMTGGSDFHGDVKPGIELGTGRGRLKLSYSIVVELKKRLPETHPLFEKPFRRLWELLHI